MTTEAQVKGLLRPLENNGKVLVDLLEKHVEALETANSEKTVLEFLSHGTIQLINTFEALKQLPCQESLAEVIDKLTDIFMIGTNAGKEVKRLLVSSITESCMDFVISSAFMVIHKIEILKSFNTVLENCTTATKNDLLGRPHFKEKMLLLLKSISQAGAFPCSFTILFLIPSENLWFQPSGLVFRENYEAQVCIIEFIFRIVPKSMRKEYLKSTFGDSTHLAEILDIQDSSFEIDCRCFLNKINKTNTCPMTRVCSYPAEHVIIDGVQLLKPSDEGYDDFWIDFNEGSKRIAIFCEPTFSCSQESQNADELWETVSVWAQDVKRYTCTAQGKLWKAVIELKPGASLLSSRRDKLSHLVTIAVPENYDMKTVIEGVLKINHKTSSVDVPICITKAHDVQTIQSTSMKRAPESSQSTTKQQGDGKMLCVVRSKISVPSEPMSTPASSVITSSVEYPVRWQELQMRQKSKELAKSTDKSDTGDTNKGGTTEDADKVKRKNKSSLERSFMNILTDADYELITQNRRNTTSTDCVQPENDNLYEHSNFEAVANETKDSCKVNVNTVGNKTCRNRSQARAQASEKCTDMRQHYMDPRASDALVDVSDAAVTVESSSVTAGGNNLCLEDCQKKYNSGIKCGLKEGDEKREQRKQEQSARKCRRKNGKKQPEKSLVTPINSSVENSQPCETTSRCLRSRKRTSTPLLSAPAATEMEKVQSESNPSQLDVIPGSFPGFLPQNWKHVSGKRRPHIEQVQTVQSKICNDVIAESTTSSFPAGTQLDNKNKAEQSNCESSKDGHKYSLNKEVTNVSKIGTIVSPGNASVDDFKPARSFRSVRGANRKALEMINDIASQGKTRRKKTQVEQSSSRKIACGNGAGDAQVSGTTLRDFISMPVAEGASCESKVLTSESKVSDPDAHKICKKAGLLSSSLDNVSTKQCTNSREVNNIGEGNTEEPTSIGKKNFITSEFSSSSSYGELFIVVEPKKNDEECDVIEETQFGMSSQLSFDTCSITGKRKNQGSEKSPNQDEQMLPKTKQGIKFPGAAGDFTACDGNMQGFSESSVLNKHTDVEAKLSPSDHVKSEKSQTKKSVSKLGSLKSKKTIELSDNSVLRQENVLLIHSSSVKKKSKVQKTVENTKAKGFNLRNSCAPFQDTEEKQRDMLDNVILAAQKCHIQNSLVTCTKNDSDGDICSGKEVKNKSGTQLEKSQSKNMQNVIADNCRATYVFPASPNGKMKKSQEDKNSMSRLGSHAPKKSRKNPETRRHGIWPSHKMEKTLTIKSYSKSVYTVTSDPYDFEAECKKKALGTSDFVPLCSGSFMKQSSDKIDASTRRAGKEKEDKNHLCQKDNFGKLDTNTEKGVGSRVRSRRSLKQKQSLSPVAEVGPQTKKNSKTESAAPRQTLDEKTQKHCPPGEVICNRSDSESDKGSSKYGLFASQCEPTKSDSGLVFPHLDDSIPCTPLQEEHIPEEPCVIIEKNSVTSDLSWLTLARKPVEKQEQKKRKTYKRNKPTKVKPATKTPNISDQTPESKTRSSIPKKHKLFSPLDIRTSSRRSSVTLLSESREENNQVNGSYDVKNPKEGTLASILTNSAQKLASILKKKVNRNLSFNTTSLKGRSDTELAENIAESSKLDGSEAESKKRRSDSGVSSSERSGPSPPSFAQHSFDIWSIVSSNIDNTVQKVSDKWSGSMDYHSLTGTISGPASTKRPTKSELKRKYPSGFSSDDGESDADSTYHGFADKDEKSTFVPRRLFKSGKTPAKSKQKTTSRKLTVKTDEELTDTQTSSQDTYPQNKRRKLSFKKPAAPYENEKVSSRKKWKKQKFTSPLNFISTSQVDYEWVYDMGCTPGKVRSQAESSGELLSRSNLESSPSLPLALSSLSSPLIGVSDRSSSVPGDLGNKDTPQTNLTDSFKMVLEKPGMPESEEEPLDVGTLDLSETVGMDFDKLEKVIVEKKTSKPLLDNDDVEEVLKSSHQFITSALQTEQNKRMNAVKMFQSVVLDALTRMNRDLKEAQEREMRTALLWTQEMSHIKRTIICQEKEMNQLKKAHDLLVCDLQSAQADGETVQKSLRTAMKRDTDALQKKLIAKCNQQALKALDALKTRLQMSLFS